MAYLRYTDLKLEEKPAERIEEDAAIMKTLTDLHSKVHTDHLEIEDEGFEQVTLSDSLSHDPYLHDRLTLSVSLIDPSLTQEQISEIPPKE